MTQKRTSNKYKEKSEKRKQKKGQRHCYSSLQTLIRLKSQMLRNLVIVKCMIVRYIA